MLKINGSTATAYKIIEEPIEEDSVLTAYMVHLAFADDPSRQDYYVGVIHLRDEEGLPKPKKYYPEAEYEIAIYALDSSLEPNPNDPDSFEFLLPPTFIKQFDGVSDEGAAFVMDKLIKLIVDGDLSLEPFIVEGARERWTLVDHSLVKWQLH